MIKRFTKKGPPTFRATRNVSFKREAALVSFTFSLEDVLISAIDPKEAQRSSSIFLNPDGSYLRLSDGNGVLLLSKS